MSRTLDVQQFRNLFESGEEVNLPASAKKRANEMEKRKRIKAPSNKRAKGYKRKEIVTIDDLSGLQAEVMRYLCRKLQKSGSFGERTWVELDCGQINKELPMEREILKNTIRRLVKKEVLKTTLKGNPKHGKVTYHIKRSIFADLYLH